MYRTTNVEDFDCEQLMENKVGRVITIRETGQRQAETLGVDEPTLVLVHLMLRDIEAFWLRYLWSPQFVITSVWGWHWTSVRRVATRMEAIH